MIQIYNVHKNDWLKFQDYVFSLGKEWMFAGRNKIKFPHSDTTNIIVYIRGDSLSHSSISFYENHYSEMKYIKYNNRQKKLKRILNG